MKARQAVEPITIQCVAGAGELPDLNGNEIRELFPGVLTTVEPEVVHEVKVSRKCRFY
jgi:hypothetical protein